MIKRPEYLDTLIRFKDKDLIKVVTGIRRCGKSTLFDLYCDYLKEQGIEEEQIIKINLEDRNYSELDDYIKLYDYIEERIIPEKNNYVFIDEVQNVPDFQKACDSLYIKKNVDLYITGSNAYLLSGELATLLSGRYIEIKMMPLSFKEYISYVGEMDLQKKYRDYITKSSFPYALNFENKKDRNFYLESIYNSIILKDIAERKRSIDITMLNSVTGYMFDNIGNLCSTTKIANSIISSGRKISVHTVDSYLQSLLDSFVLYKAERYDIKGKQYLASGYKYYVCDIGLRYYLLGDKPVDAGHILENVVYLELLRRGYQVYVGKNGDSEVDFIAIGENGEEYYQVCYSVREEDTLKRELMPLDTISDHNPKYLLTMDDEPIMSHNGIKQIYVLDWLLNK